MDATVEATGVIAKVARIDPDGRSVHLRREDGQTVSVTSSAPWEYGVGSVVILDGEAGRVQLAPDDLWTPRNSWVGVVKLVNSAFVIVSRGGQLERLPPTGIEVKEGFTVQVADGEGVVSVLSQTPIRALADELGRAADAGMFRRDTGAEATGPTFSDFGGYPEVVARARELIETSLKKSDALRDIGAKPIKGVLFTGRPGTGKTTLARIVARESEAAFYEISGPQVFSKYVGDSEELLRAIFEEAGSHAGGAIIFFDEIDSVAGRRTDGGNDVSRRVVAQLLTLMDGFVPSSKVLVIAATNRPQDLDDAVRRPGRFDWEIDFPMPAEGDRLGILRATSLRIKAVTDLPHERVARLTEGWSPAALNAIWTEAALIAVRRDHTHVYAEDYLAGYERVGLRYSAAADEEGTR